MVGTGQQGYVVGTLHDTATALQQQLAQGEGDLGGSCQKAMRPYGKAPAEDASGFLRSLVSPFREQKPLLLDHLQDQKTGPNEPGGGELGRDEDGPGRILASLEPEGTCLHSAEGRSETSRQMLSKVEGRGTWIGAGSGNQEDGLNGAVAGDGGDLRSTPSRAHNDTAADDRSHNGTGLTTV
ncbi:hypothetical protein PG997_011014 [Apiospora hydei]|uniref:Uncharacterized protein n=1 Tax=Apiospora hydei TaxID=1337664 RepID=A0ABR1VHU9_9PEZI